MIRSVVLLIWGQEMTLKRWHLSCDRKRKEVRGTGPEAGQQVARGDLPGPGGRARGVDFTQKYRGALGHFKQDGDTI